MIPTSRRSERGAAILLLLVTLVALLGIGAITMLAVQPGARPVAGRHEAEALQAAESGVAAALAWLRQGCDRGPLPERPAAIYGNGIAPGAEGNPFAAAADLAYEVTLLNDPTDPGGSQDTDGRLLVRSVGRRARAEVVVEAEIEDPGCPGEPDFAQAHSLP